MNCKQMMYLSDVVHVKQQPIGRYMGEMRRTYRKETYTDMIYTKDMINKKKNDLSDVIYTWV